MSEAVSLSEFARLLGVVPSYVTKLKQAGRLELNDDGLVRVEASKQRIEETKDPNRDDVAARHAREREAAAGAAPPVDAPDPQSPAAQGFAAARAVKERYFALSAKLEYERAIGKMVEVAAVKAAGAEVGTILRAAFDNLPDQIAPLLTPLTDEDQVRIRLKENIDLVLTEVADRIVAAIGKLTEPA
jgi:hypothetical protein